MRSEQNHKIFSVLPQDFDPLALATFRWQYQYNTIYKEYVNALHIDPASVLSADKIPFLPVRFFKSHVVQTGEFTPVLLFESSGTTDIVNSRHAVRDPALYEQSFLSAFEAAYGPVREWCILGLLPSYLERTNSSLVYMVDRLIKMGGHAQSGFYLDEFEKLFRLLGNLEAQKQKTLLFGVSFALLDFSEQYALPLRHTIIMETGGMKGRREEMTRPELHDRLKAAFSVDTIHSEYGMTELLTQAYSKGDGIFHSPPWMKIVLRDEEDPLNVKGPATTHTITGAINIIDLANRDSCSFIATDDAGRLYPDGGFEVLGRLDGSDLRGCSMLVV